MEKGYLSTWGELVESADGVSALGAHLAPWADGISCHEILAEFSSKVLSVSIATPPPMINADGASHVLHCLLPYCEDGESFDEEAPFDLWLYPPYEGPIDSAVPASYARMARLHRRLILKSRAYDGALIWWGLNSSGTLGEAASHDMRTHRGGQDEQFLRRLRDAGRAIEDVHVPVNALENWYLLNCFELGADGEPRWSYVSHEDGKVRPALRTELSLSASFLRILAKEFVAHRDARPIK